MDDRTPLPLLERDAEMSALRAAFENVQRTSRGRLAFVSGAAGIGKTALVREFTAQVPAPGTVLRAACEPLFVPRPLGPLIELAAAMGSGLAAEFDHASRPYDVASSLLRVLGKGRARAAQGGRAAQASRSAAALLVIEDAHWADEATLDVIRLLARKIDGVPALLVVTYRDDLDRAHPLRVVLGELPEPVTRVTLSDLSAEAVATLAEPGGLDAGELHRRTGGNPFFVTEVLAAGTSQVPQTVRDAVLARVARLSAPAREVLDGASVVPGMVDRWLLAALAPAMTAGLDECLDAGVLTTEDSLVAFRHDMARQVIQESLPPGLRSSLHRRALVAIADDGAIAPDMARLAHHAEGAGDAEAVLHFAPAAAEHAAASGGHREAAGHYSRALRFAHRITPSRRAELLERFAEEAYILSMGEDAIAALREALAIHQASGDLVAQGRTLRQLGRQYGQNTALKESAAMADAAIAVLEQVMPGPELARAYAGKAAIVGMLGDSTESIRWGLKAIALAEQTDCTDALIYGLNNVGTIELRGGDDAGLAKLERSRDLAEQAGDEEAVGRAHLHRCLVLVTRREWAAADKYLRPAVAYCQDHGLVAWFDWLSVLKAEADVALGRWDEAVREAAVIAAMPGERHPVSRSSALVVLAKVQARRGEPGYWPLLDEAQELAKSTGTLHLLPSVAVARAEAAWLEGRSVRAIREATEVAAGSAGLPATMLAPELAYWQWRAGLVVDDPGQVAEPYRLEMAGDSLSAARWWEAKNCPYEAALALASSDDVAAIRRAMEMMRELGAAQAAAIVGRRLRSLGERGIPRGPRPATAANPTGLTVRELEILALIRGGLRNAEIAAELTLSVRTVDHHVAAILRKIGARNRSHAIAMAQELLASPPGSEPDAGLPEVSR